MSEDIAGISPTPERQLRGAVERDERQTADVNGNIGDPWRTIPILERMERRGAITSDMRRAGERFREDFAYAQLDVLRAADMGRLAGGASQPYVSFRVEAARHRVWKAICALGGLVSIKGSCAWNVIGLDQSLKVWRTTYAPAIGACLSAYNSLKCLRDTVDALSEFYGK